MPRTFICSIGTSAAKLLVDEAGRRLAPGKLRQWVQDLERDGVGTGFRFGAAARIDAEQFRRVGVVEFTKRCLREIDDLATLWCDAPRRNSRRGASCHTPPRYRFSVSGEESNVVLNPTGGFKTLVPYTVLIGMWKNVPCRYIFEQSTTLLELPPLPVEFSRSRFEAFKSLFERIERDSSVSLADWNADRYLVSVEGWRLLVWRAIREDQVGPNYPQQVTVDASRDRAKYAPLTRLEFVP